MHEGAGEQGERPGPHPSPTSVRRLRRALDAVVGDYTRELDTDLDDIGRAGATARADLAVAVAEEQLARLEELHVELRRVIADAVVEREAEAVLAAAPRPIPSAADGRPPASTAVRRALVAVGAVVAVAVALAQPPTPPGDPLLAAATVSDQVVVAALQATEGTADVAAVAALSVRMQDAVADLDAADLADPAVRSRLEGMLADQQDALVRLSARLPQAALVLEDLRDLARALQVALPPVPADPVADALADPDDAGDADDAGPQPSGDGARPDAGGPEEGSTGGSSDPPTGRPADQADPAADDRPAEDPQPAPPPADEPADEPAPEPADPLGELVEDAGQGAGQGGDQGGGEGAPAVEGGADDLHRDLGGS